MKVYIPTCQEFDPSTGERLPLKILGVFTNKTTADESFARVEPQDGWTRKHICYMGDHEVLETEIGEWTPLGIS